jgi:hypothetical protein
VAELVARLVGDDLTLYRHLLGDPARGEYHLAPLRGRPHGAWAGKAVLAMDAGLAPEAIVRAAFRHDEWVRGDRSSYEEAWVAAFEALNAHPDSRVRRVGEIGRATARGRLESALRDEQAEAVFGEW